MSSLPPNKSVDYTGNNGLTKILDNAGKSINPVTNKSENEAADPLVLIATDIIAMPFGLMLKFGEQLAKFNKKDEGSIAVSNAMMMHEWANAVIKEWKDNYNKENPNDH